MTDDGPPFASSRWYILDEHHKPVPARSLVQWARWFENVEGRRVAGTQIGPLWISTVFLGLDHNFIDEGPPLLFETMILGFDDDNYQTRCATWDEAKRMHATAVDIAETLAAAANVTLEAFSEQMGVRLGITYERTADDPDD